MPGGGSVSRPAVRSEEEGRGSRGTDCSAALGSASRGRKRHPTAGHPLQGRSREGEGGRASRRRSSGRPEDAAAPAVVAAAGGGAPGAGSEGLRAHGKAGWFLSLLPPSPPSPRRGSRAPGRGPFPEAAGLRLCLPTHKGTCGSRRVPYQASMERLTLLMLLVTLLEKFPPTHAPAHYTAQHFSCIQNTQGAPPQ